MLCPQVRENLHRTQAVDLAGIDAAGEEEVRQVIFRVEQHRHQARVRLQVAQRRPHPPGLGNGVFGYPGDRFPVFGDDPPAAGSRTWPSESSPSSGTLTAAMPQHPP